MNNLVKLTRAAAKLLVAACAAIPALTVAQATQWTAPKPLNSYAYTDNTSSHEERPLIATDGAGNWLTAWYPANRGLHDLAFSRSQDVGASWGESTEVDFGTSGSLSSASLAYAGNNIWVVMWRAHNNLVYTPDENYVFAASSADYGQTWSTPVRVDVGGAVTAQVESLYHPDLAADGNGNLLALWKFRTDNSSTETKTVVVSSTDFGLSWSSPEIVEVIDAEESLWDNAQLAYAGAGKWILIHSDSEPVDPANPFGFNTQVISAATSNDLGATWSSLGPVYHDVTSDRGGVSFEVHGQDGMAVVAAWNPLAIFQENYFNSGFAVFLSNDTLTTFSGPLKVISPTHVGDSGTFSLAADVAGNWAMVAHNYSFFLAPQIWQSSDVDTTWTLTQVLSSGDNRAVNIAGAETGDFVAVMQHVSSEAVVYERDNDIQSVSSTDGGLTWENPVYVNDSALADGLSVHDFNLDFETGDSVMIAAWQAQVGFGSNTPIMISRSGDNGATWGTAQPLPSANGPLPQVLYLGDQNWLVTWNQYSKTASFSSDNGATWSAPYQIQASVVASNDNGTLVKAQPNFSSGTGVTFSRSTDAGQTWVAENAQLVSGIKFIVHSGGQNWIAVGEGNQLLLSNDDGAHWGTFLNAPLTIQSIATNHDGTVVVTQSSRQSESDPDTYTLNTHASVSTDHGMTWTPATLVHTQSRMFNSAPIVAYDGYPEALFLQGDKWALFIKNILSSRYLPLDVNRANFIDLFYVVSEDGGATWGTPDLVMDSSRFSASTITDYAAMRGTVTIGYEYADSYSNPTSLGSDRDLLYINHRIPGTQTAASDWALFE